MRIDFDKVKKLFEANGYYANDRLIWQTIINLQKAKEGLAGGQEIHAICLEGPPGAGKTFYAETYYKVLASILDEDVELVQYQCNATTGKKELYEDIRVAAAISGDGENVLIPGKVAEAIEKVIAGKRVVLFLDEYDKAREETDSFLLDFLQEGRINTTQKGELEIPVEYMQNLQVILCKNDAREELSGPLSRRLKTVRLDYMDPEIFKKVSKNALKDADPNIREAVCTFYFMLYRNQDNYKRIPACSELLMAIQDADILLKNNVDDRYIYSAIISNMLKTKEDIETFKSVILKDPNFEGIADKVSADERTPDADSKSFRKMAFETFFTSDVLTIAKLIEERNKLAVELGAVCEKNKHLSEEITKHEGMLQRVANVQQVRSKYEEIYSNAQKSRTTKSVDLSQWVEFVQEGAQIEGSLTEHIVFDVKGDIVGNITESQVEQIMKNGGYLGERLLVIDKKGKDVLCLDLSTPNECAVKSNYNFSNDELGKVLNSFFMLSVKELKVNRATKKAERLIDNTMR